jgi:DNA-directed RNA polymerase subunit RPC12/RpoP
MDRVYVLNNSFECVSTTTIGRALYLIEQGHADVVKWSNVKLHSIKKIIPIPLIIRIFKYVKAFGRSLPYSNRFVWERDNYSCQYCGEKILIKANVTTDHVFPASKGGKAVYDNMVTCCKACNSKKDDKTCEEAHMFPIRKPVRPYMSKSMTIISNEAKRLLALKNKDDSTGGDYEHN